MHPAGHSRRHFLGMFGATLAAGMGISRRGARPLARQHAGVRAHPPGPPCKDPLPEAGLWQDPKDCQCFYQCAADNTAVRECCPKGQEFDDINKVCAKKGSVVCGDTPPLVDCRGKGDGDYPDPHNCSHYWSCTNQLSIGPRDCPTGLHFKVTGEGKGKCVQPKEAGCK
jgi:hypothetical protein